MSDRVFKQPNGNYAIFSSIVDGFTLYDATAEEIADHYASRGADEARRLARQAVERADEGRFILGPRTWAEAVALNDKHHPDDPVANYLSDPA